MAASAVESQAENNSESKSSEKNPQITNPHWEDAAGNTITKALVGDEVTLCAATHNIADGTSATIKIVEKDTDGNDDDVATLKTTVQNNTIECAWNVVYTADDDDADSEQEEKGYTLPEYAFTIECDGEKSGESPRLNVRGWIKVQLKDKKAGYPLSNAKYTIYLLDGSEIKGTSDNDGIVYLDNIKFGKYFISIGV